MSINSHSNVQAELGQGLLSKTRIDTNSVSVPTTPEAHKNKLGTLNGCYVPCLLNIMGIILFQRLGWGIGQVGVSGVLLIFLIAEFQAIITVLSLSAIVTNGNMKGGGSYYMISRTLGPEFGGSIGLLFYAAYCVGVALYASGFAEEVVETWFADSGHKYWLQNGFASMVLFIALIVAMIGADAFTKINVPLFFFQFLAIFIALIACSFRGTFDLYGEEMECQTDGVADGELKHFEWSLSRFVAAWNFECPSCQSFAATFGVLFPAATGIMEGANLSGDLKNPTYSIPVGTLSAIATSITFYLLLIVSFSGSFSPCTLRNDTTIMQEAAWGDFGTYLVVGGIVISASSSALGSLFGGSRVLQAIARDRLFPYTRWFAFGSLKGDEPRRAVLFTWAIAQGLVFVGGLDVIAPIATAFFCLSYATVNFSCFLLAISGTPNFRPAFRFYSWHTALAGTISNLVVMFYVDWKFALGACALEIAVFVALIYRDPQTVWGDVAQSLIFHQVRKYLLKLDERKGHVKAWRPSLLLLADSQYAALIDFCNNLKKGGLYIIGATVPGEFGDFESTTALRSEWIDFIDRNGLKAFPQINVAPNVRNGLENLILLSGLGALNPNTVILPILRMMRNDKKAAIAGPAESDDDASGGDEEEDAKQREPSRSALSSEYCFEDTLDAECSPTMSSLVPQTPAALEAMEYTKLCRNTLKFNKNVLITANFHSFASRLIASDRMALDFAAQNGGDVELIDSPKREPAAPAVAQKKGKTETMISIADGDDAFLSKTVLHDVVRAASVPALRDEAQWIDVWLFASDYSFDLSQIARNRRDDTFPMLMMQFQRILLQNKVWAQKARAKTRVLLMVDNRWNKEDRANFDALLQQLRLTEVEVQVLKEPDNFSKPRWQSIIEGKRRGTNLKKYYNALNQTMKLMSGETYFTFLALPEFPPVVEGDDEMNQRLNLMYYQALYVLLRGLPPTALVATGEVEPVISIDL